MKITINIKTDNAAFQDNPEELQNILTKAVEDIAQSGRKERMLYDSNGNKVGNYKIASIEAEDIENYNELMSLVDGVFELVELSAVNYSLTSPAQRVWKNNWLKRARTVLGGMGG